MLLPCDTHPFDQFIVRTDLEIPDYETIDRNTNILQGLVGQWFLKIKNNECFRSFQRYCHQLLFIFSDVFSFFCGMLSLTKCSNSSISPDAFYFLSIFLYNSFSLFQKAKQVENFPFEKNPFNEFQTF